MPLIKIPETTDIIDSGLKSYLNNVIKTLKLNFEYILNLITGLKITNEQNMCLHFEPTRGNKYAIVLSNSSIKSTTTVTNTTTETTFFTKTIPANSICEGTLVEFMCRGSYSNASASDDFSIKFKVNGTTIHTINRIGGNETDAGWESIGCLTFRTIGTSGAFVHFFRYIENNSSVYAKGDSVEHSVDTTVDNTITMTIQWDNAKTGNTFTCLQGNITFSD